jgi:TIR domain
MTPSATNATARVFVSHGKQDSWIAAQFASLIQACGVSTFLDETDIAKGDDFKKRIHVEVAKCTELVALFTPWSATRFWVWVEVGAAWGQGKCIVAVLCGLTVADLAQLGGSRAILEDINILSINDFDAYLRDLRARQQEGTGG